MINNKFISFEGIDGSGKTTQIVLLKKWFNENNIPVIFTREPGGTKLGEHIRRLVLTDKNLNIDSISELLLMFTARSQHYNEIIKPALDKKMWVVTDRFYDSSIAYQGYGRGVSLQKINYLIETFLPTAIPDLTLLLSIPLTIIKKRITGQERFEQENLDFYERVDNGYKKLHKKYPDRITKIDGTLSIPEINKQIITKISNLQ